MDDIYSNLENYNEETTLTELQNENKELKCKLEEYAANLDKLQRDFDKLSSEHKKLELNYSSLLKTARSELERKTQLISTLNAEKDVLVLKSMQNRNLKFTRNFPNYKGNLPNRTKEDEPRFEKKDVVESHNLELDRFLPKEDKVRSGTDSSTKENISNKRTNIEENKPKTIRNRRKSMPGFSMPAAKFSSDEDDAPFPGRNLPSKERDYPDKNLDRNCKPTNRTSEGLDDRNTGNYERNRYHRNVEPDKFRIHDRTDFSQRHKRDGSPGRHRRRPRDVYEDHQRMEHDKYRRHDSPIDKFNPYPRRPRSNYDRPFQEQERYKHRNQDRYSKHKISEYDEPKNKRMRPDSYARYEEEKWSPEMQQMSEEFEKQYASCQSPDINFLEPNPNHQIREIKLTANTQLDDPRKSSESYVVKKNEGKETITAVRGIDVEIVPIPLEKSLYDIKSIKMPEALKEKPITDDLVNEIYKDVDNPLLNDSVESGEIPCDPQDIVHRYEIKSASNTKEDSTKTDSINANIQQPLASYRIPKLKICRSFTQGDNNTRVALSIKRDDDNKSKNIISGNKNSSKSVPKIDLDLKKDDVNVKDKAPISKHTPLPLFSSHIDKLNHDHIKTKAAMKMVEDDLELSDETCDTDTREKITKTNNSNSDKLDHKTETKGITSKAKCDADNKDVNIATDNDKKVKHRKRQHKHKNSPDEVKSKISPTEKPTKKKIKEKEVKTKEIKTKFSELFGDSSSLISPEDLGLIAVQPPLNQPVAGIFEDAQDAVDVNVKDTSVSPETIVDTTVVEVKKNDDKIEEVNKDLSTEINKTNEVTDKNLTRPQINDVPIQSVYENLEVGPKIKETNVKTVIISTGVQPSTAVFNKPSVKNLDQLEFPVKPPEQIDLKALATSTPLKLDVQNVLSNDPKTIETNGNTNDIRNESTDNDTTDVSNSNIDSKTNEADVPDIRMFVKRRRKVIRK